MLKKKKKKKNLPIVSEQTVGLAGLPLLGEKVDI